jgi:putative lipoic acid-binding regulatory protein
MDEAPHMMRRFAFGAPRTSRLPLHHGSPMLTAMKDLDDIRAQSPEQGFQFPGVFEINAMGSASAQLERKVVEVLEGLGLSVLAGSQRVKPSRGGNYVSVSVSFTCPSRELYDAAHAALRADPAIRWTL